MMVLCCVPDPSDLLCMMQSAETDMEKNRIYAMECERRNQV